MKAPVRHCDRCGVALHDGRGPFDLRLCRSCHIKLDMDIAEEDRKLETRAQPGQPNGFTSDNPGWAS